MANPSTMTNIEGDWAENLYRDGGKSKKCSGPLILLTSNRGRLTTWSRTMRDAMRAAA